MSKKQRAQLSDNFDKIKTMNADGMNLPEICAELGIAHHSSRNYLREMGFDPKRHGHNKGSSIYAEQLNYHYEEVVQLLTQGHSLVEVCEDRGLDYMTFYKNVKAKDPTLLSRAKKSERIRQKMSDANKIPLDEDEIVRLYREEKMSALKISERFGVVQNVILKRLKDRGVELNDQSEYWTNERRAHYKKLGHDGIIGIHAQGDGAYRFTDIERKFAKWCDERAITYERQFQLTSGHHRYDFHVIGTNLLVETDGLFWHDTETQSAKDLIHDEQAAQQGYDVLRFSDKEIYETKEGCFNEVYKWLKT